MFAVINATEPERHIFVFNTGADAGKCAADFNATARNSGDAKRYRVIPVKTADVDDAWKQREIRRFLDGAYKHVPWSKEPWNRVCHYAHISTEQDGKIAYTPNDEYGAADRQIRMRPGRYLTQHYADVLNPEQIKEWCAKLAAEDTPLKFAHTPDDIQWVYENGPSSCMSHKADNYSSSCHPVRVYGAGDLAVAYTTNDAGRVSARAICWPKKQIHGRTYGDDNLLCELLDDAGYVYGRNGHEWNGARLLRVEDDDDGLVAPYLDDPNYSVDDDGKFLVINESGDIICRETNGLSASGGEYRCANCEERCHETYTVDGEDWCQGCYENYSYHCYDCDESYSGSPYACDHRGNDLCESCGREYSTCIRCDEWFHGDDLVYSEVTHESYCQHCADRYMERTPCGEIAENEDDCDCSTCEQRRADDEAENFELSSDDGAAEPTERVAVVHLKPTSSHIDDPRQLYLGMPWEIHPASAWQNMRPIEREGAPLTVRELLYGRNA